jgi:hypothetical protein
MGDQAATPAAKEKITGPGGGCQGGRGMRSRLDMFLFFFPFVPELMLIRVVDSDIVFGC